MSFSRTEIAALNSLTWASLALLRAARMLAPACNIVSDDGFGPVKTACESTVTPGFKRLARPRKFVQPHEMHSGMSLSSRGIEW